MGVLMKPGKKYQLPFGHTTLDRKLYESSIKRFPPSTFIEKPEYEKWLNMRSQLHPHKNYLNAQATAFICWICDEIQPLNAYSEHTQNPQNTPTPR